MCEIWKLVWFVDVNARAVSNIAHVFLYYLWTYFIFSSSMLEAAICMCFGEGLHWKKSLNLQGNTSDRPVFLVWLLYCKCFAVNFAKFFTSNFLGKTYKQLLLIFLLLTLPSLSFKSKHKGTIYVHFRMFSSDNEDLWVFTIWSQSMNTMAFFTTGLSIGRCICQTEGRLNAS